MNPPSLNYGEHDEEDDEIFIEDDDIVQEIIVDDEDLPDVDEDSDGDPTDETDDSIYKFTGHKGELYTVACSPIDFTLVATGGGDDKGFLWSVRGDRAFELQGHKDSVSSLAFSSDGQLLASGSFDGYVQVRDTLSRNLKWQLEGPAKGIEEGVTCLSWLGASNFVATGSVDGKVRIWDSRSGACVKTFSGHTDAIQSIAISANGDHLVSAALDRTARAFDIAEWFG